MGTVERVGRGMAFGGGWPAERVFEVEAEFVEGEEVFRESMGDRYIARRSYDI